MGLYIGFLSKTNPCRSCRRLRSFDLVQAPSKSKDRSLRQLLQGMLSAERTVQMDIAGFQGKQLRVRLINQPTPLSLIKLHGIT
jgi:hypothetical protein